MRYFASPGYRFLKIGCLDFHLSFTAYRELWQFRIVKVWEGLLMDLGPCRLLWRVKHK